MGSRMQGCLDEAEMQRKLQVLAENTANVVKHVNVITLKACYEFDLKLR